VIAKYRGENLYLRVADFSAIGKSFDSFAFAAGGLGSVQVNATPHEGFGSQGLLELNADVTYGAIGGFSIPFNERFSAGLTAKMLQRQSIHHDFTAQEIVEKQDNLGDYIQDDLRKKGSAFGFDVGMLWKIEPESYWRPAVGLSVLNIGDLDFGDAGKIPMTVNVGVSANPRIPFFRSLILGLDYVDVLNNFDQDKDKMKRLRYGAELQLFDVWPAEVSVRVGMYEGYPTFGADVRLLTFLVSYTLYSEEVGAYAGQDKDTRQLLTFNFGW
ncbi:MAG: hypothetical protein M0042_14560, partial [Nitrospiraceae bacterium]|nr:hypothetical protein [Nitrospiraceae bacterium]